MKQIHGKTIRTRLSNLVTSSQLIIESSLADAVKTDDIKAFPEKTLAKFKVGGFLTASIPDRYGGLDLGLVPGTNLALLIVLKNIGKGNLVMGRVLEGHINAQILIDRYASEKQKKLFAQDAMDGRLFGVWNTQAADGTILKKIKKDTYQLTGSKIFATGTDHVTRPIVTAAMKDGSWQMCVVPLDQVDVRSDASWWEPMGMRSSRSFKMTFLRSHIEKVNLLGSGGDYYQQPEFSSGAIRFAAVQLGAAEQLLDETKKYLVTLDRTQDAFQKMRIGQMAISVESGNQWIKGASSRLDEYMESPTKVNGEKLIIFANMMRTAIEQICTEVMSLCQKCVGARGLNKPYHFERIIRDLSTYLRQPAPDEVLADVGNFVLTYNDPSAEILI